MKLYTNIPMPTTTAHLTYPFCIAVTCTIDKRSKRKLRFCQTVSSLFYNKMSVNKKICWHPKYFFSPFLAEQILNLRFFSFVMFRKDLTTFTDFVHVTYRH